MTADAAGDDAAQASAGPPPHDTDAALARRAQILATEHWGLLAARSTAQNEVLTRITIFLTLVSAGLVTIGLLGQATRFSDGFAPAALSILGFLVVIGLLTQIRVFNVADEDLMFVLAMNRLRGAYVDLDPDVEEYFLEGTTDDLLGMQITYSFLKPRSDASQVLGSSFFLIAVVNSCVVGLLAGGVVAAFGAPLWASITAGVITGCLLLLATALHLARSYRDVWRRWRPRRTLSELPPHLRPERHSRGEHVARRSADRG